MRPGTKPKPTALKIVQGNPGHRKLNKHEPKPEAILPPPPEHLDDGAKFYWVELAPKLHKLKLLTDLDLTAFEMLADTYARRREARDMLKKTGLLVRTKEGNFIQSPLVGIVHKCTAIIERLLAQFGMTPSSRSGLSVGKDQAAEEFKYER